MDVFTLCVQGLCTGFVCRDCVEVVVKISPRAVWLYTISTLKHSKYTTMNNSKALKEKPSFMKEVHFSTFLFFLSFVLSSFHSRYHCSDQMLAI